MPDEALQAAFEIKAACDDISRKLLRWHWEEKPGAHSVDALLKHLAQRQKENPDYYERLPELNLSLIHISSTPLHLKWISSAVRVTREMFLKVRQTACSPLTSPLSSSTQTNCTGLPGV